MYPQVSLKAEEGSQSGGQGDATWRLDHSGFEDGDKWSWSKEDTQPPEAGEGKEKILP